MIELENKTLKLSVDLSGQWTSLYDKENEVEHLFAGSPHSYNRQAPLLFPIIGLLKDNKYIHHGQLYELGRHGFLRDQSFDVLSQTKNEVVLWFTHNDQTYEVYPFEFGIELRISLKKNKVVTKTIITNLGKNPMYFNFGSHPGFNINHHEENKVILSGKKEMGEFILEDGFVKDYKTIDQNEFNLKDLNLEETVVYHNIKKATIETPTHYLSMSLNPTSTIALWSTQNSQTNSMEQMICVEPWWGMSDCTFHNQHLKDKKGIFKLLENESKKFEYTLEIKNKDLVPAAIGPYALARQTDDLIYTSGQLPINPRTNQIEVDDIVGQTKQVLRNLKALLAGYNKDLSDIIKITVFLKDMNDFAQMNEVYGQFFEEPYPARSAVEVARLPKDALVEIEVIVAK